MGETASPDPALAVASGGRDRPAGLTATSIVVIGPEGG